MMSDGSWGEATEDLGLIGPRGGGKTQFKVFLITDPPDPPPYMFHLFHVPTVHGIKGSDALLERRLTTSLGPVFSDQFGTMYQQFFHPTKEIHPLQVQYTDGSADNRFPTVRVMDFPGESFTTDAQEGSDEYPEEMVRFERNFEQLCKIDSFVFVVPFWHLFPAAIMETLVGGWDRQEVSVQQSAVPAETDPGSSNSRMHQDMGNWLRYLDKLVGKDPRPRRLIVALSQLGGDTRKQCERILSSKFFDTPEETVVEQFQALLTAADRMQEIERASFGAGSPRSLAILPQAVARLRALRRAAADFIDACADTDNRSAKGIRNLVRPWTREQLAFNVIDGRRQEVETHSGKAWGYRLDPVNAHLVLLAFWQEAIRDLVW